MLRKLKPDYLNAILYKNNFFGFYIWRVPTTDILEFLIYHLLKLVQHFTFLLCGTCADIRMLFAPSPVISGGSKISRTNIFSARVCVTRGHQWLCSHLTCLCRVWAEAFSVLRVVIFCFLCLAAVLWCSGSHIYGVSEGQWRLLPGSARCLCRRVNRQTRHRSDALEPQEGPRKLAGPGHLPEPALTRSGWGNSTRCTLPSSASAWPESRWNQPCFSFFLPFL